MDVKKEPWRKQTHNGQTCGHDYIFFKCQANVNPLALRKNGKHFVLEQRLILFRHVWLDLKLYTVYSWKAIWNYYGQVTGLFCSDISKQLTPKKNYLLLVCQSEFNILCKKM